MEWGKGNEGRNKRFHLLSCQLDDKNTKFFLFIDNHFFSLATILVVLVFGLSSVMHVEYVGNAGYVMASVHHTGHIRFSFSTYMLITHTPFTASGFVKYPYISFTISFLQTDLVTISNVAAKSRYNKFRRSFIQYTILLFTFKSCTMQVTFLRSQFFSI